MDILRLCALLALVVTARAAPVAQDCGTTSFFVDDYLNQGFQLGPEQKCVYSFNWRANAGAYIAALAYGLDSDYQTSATIYNDFTGGNYYHFGNQSDGSFLREVNTYWAPGTVKLSITTGSNSNLAMNIIVSVLNTIKDAIVASTQVVTGNQPIVVSTEMKYGTTYVYTSTSRIVLAITGPSLYFNGNGTYFDSVFVYDGQGATARLLGSLKQIYTVHNPSSLLLQSNSLTLLPLSQAKLEGKVIINNQQNIGAFDENIMMYLFSHDDRYTVTGFGVGFSGSSATIVSFGGNQNDYPIIKKIVFEDPTAVLQVFSGFPTNRMAGNYIKQYTNASVTNMPAQPFPGSTAITFIANKGYAHVWYTSALTPDMTI